MTFRYSEVSQCYSLVRCCGVVISAGMVTCRGDGFRYGLVRHGIVPFCNGYVLCGWAEAKYGRDLLCYGKVGWGVVRCRGVMQW